MNDEKMMYGLRTAVEIINMLLMVTTLVLQLNAFNALRHVFLCSCVLLLIAVELVFNKILKDSEGVTRCGWWYVLWLIDLIANLFKI